MSVVYEKTGALRASMGSSHPPLVMVFDKTGQEDEEDIHGEEVF